jgi:Putative esterase
MAAAIGVVALVVVGAYVSGTIDSSNATLLLMGFDANRSQLITSLLIAGTAAAAATLLTNRSSQATFAGMGGFAVLFGYTFAHQTRVATKATGANGSFSLTGWVLTFVTLAMVAMISSWAGATLAKAVRPGLIEAGSAVRDSIANRRVSRRLRQTVLAIAVLALLVVSVPVFGDLVNYTTDSQMTHGGPPPVGLIPQVGGQDGGQSVSGDRPWYGRRPAGRGSVAKFNLPAPWTSAASTTEDIGVYTPPGYDPKGAQRYPVLYETPFDYDAWDSSINIGVALDSMITNGTIPPMIVVFINAWRAPVAGMACADPADGSPGMETFITKTVVSHLDTNYMTIAAPEARAVTGFSTGGYCAAILPIRHPDLFGTGIPISGYFWAGEGDVNESIPFNGNAEALAAASPMIAVVRLAPEQRAKLFFVVVSKPGQPFFGFEAAEFQHLLADLSCPYVAVSSEFPHGWDQVRQSLPDALAAWGEHLAAVKTT